jgi:hypothetical protein
MLNKPIYAIVDAADALIAQPEQLPAVALDWFRDSADAREAAERDGCVAVYRVLGEGVWQRID